MALQEGAKVASGTVEALRSQPLALALIVVNVLFLGSAVWLFHEVSMQTAEERNHRNALLTQALTSCGEKIIDSVDDATKLMQHGFDQVLNAIKAK
jgi:uncharacterized protein HemX